MNFASDNWAGASDHVSARLAEAATGFAPAYGNDPLTGAATDALARFFEHDVKVFFVATGTAANSLALAATSRPGGVGFCHVDAHVIADEAGAPMALGGVRLEGIPGRNGRIDPRALDETLDRTAEGSPRSGLPVVVSVTQVTEAGTVYTPDEIERIADIAARRDMPTHMDGARFCNALVHLGMRPADLTWERGVDVMSLGFTKTGGWCAEAVVFFDDALARDFALRRMAAGQLFSKSRFVAAQVLAILEDDHWRELAGHANRMAALLAQRIEDSSCARLAWPSQSNEVFAYVQAEAAANLKAAGASFYPWHARGLDPDQLPRPDEDLYRFVTCFRTDIEEIDRFADVLWKASS